MKKFKDLTEKQQRVRIIKDAIAQIKLKNFKISTGNYLKFPVGTDGNTYYPTDTESIQKTLTERKCECCAKGAVFAACVLNVNKVYGKDDYGNEDFQKKKLRKWFKPLELDMMETAFEGRVCEDSTDKLQAQTGAEDYWGDQEWEPTGLGKECIKFGSKYKNPRNRLMAILENILEFGTFKP